MKPELRPAIFMDRDGTLMEEVDYCRSPKDVRIFPGTPEWLAKANHKGWVTVIITNQSGIGRGYFGVQDYEAVQAELCRQLQPGRIDASYMCPDHPDQAGPRRKPSPVMLQEAAVDLGIDLCRSWMIGDKAIDVEAGRRAGCRTILVHTGYGIGQIETSSADKDLKDIVAALGWILGNSEASLAMTTPGA